MCLDLNDAIRNEMSTDCAIFLREVKSKVKGFTFFS